MSGGAEPVRAVLRALAEARDGDFYRLMVGLSGEQGGRPSIDFRIYKVADTPDALAVVGVKFTRGDGGSEVVWSVAVTATEEKLLIEGTVETSAASSQGYVELFGRRAETADAGHAARLVGEIAAEVCRVDVPAV